MDYGSWGGHPELLCPERREISVGEMVRVAQQLAMQHVGSRTWNRVVKEYGPPISSVNPCVIGAEILHAGGSWEDAEVFFNSDMGGFCANEEHGLHKPVWGVVPVTHIL